MNIRRIEDLDTPIGDLLQAAGGGGVVLESSPETRYALLPLDDDLIDFLLERDPKFIAMCGEIRERMKSGRFESHESLRGSFGEQPEDK